MIDRRDSSISERLRLMSQYYSVGASAVRSTSMMTMTMLMLMWYSILQYIHIIAVVPTGL
jgi:hypothetical protein